MCCPGCQAVAQTILECGLVSYYEHRTAPGSKGSWCRASWRPHHYDLAEVQQEFVTETGAGASGRSSSPWRLTCAACAWLIERHLSKLSGLHYVNVNTTTHRARIQSGIRTGLA